MGMSSSFWPLFVSSGEKQKWYSIALARTSTSWNTQLMALSATSSLSNITFGANDSSAYAGQSMLNISQVSVAGELTFGYLVSKAGFGKVYFQDGVASSQYFKFPQSSMNMTAFFDTAYPSLSVPNELYEDFFKLFKQAFKGLECENFGIGCSLPSTCATYNSHFENFSFQVFFNSSSNGNYINIPMSTYFVEDTTTGQCTFMFTSSKKNEFVIGGMFFEEFYGQFYSNAGFRNTIAQIFVGQNSQFSWAYVGNQELKQGKNPFKYHAGLTIWQWCLVALGGVLLIALIAYGVYFCVKKNKAGDKNEMLAVIYSPKAAE